VRTKAHHRGLERRETHHRQRLERQRGRKATFAATIAALSVAAPACGWPTCPQRGNSFTGYDYHDASQFSGEARDSTVTLYDDAMGGERAL
jgi:hypothetical protein